MVTKYGESNKNSFQNKTINGFYVNVYLEHTTVNQTLLPTQYGTNLQFDPSQISMKAMLKRDGKNIQLFSDNLGLIGRFNSILKGAKEWQLGTDKQRPAAGAVHKNVRTLFIYLGSHLNVKDTDECVYEMNVGRTSFLSPLDQNKCYVEMTPAFSIGYESGVYSQNFETVKAHTTSQDFNLGDNVTDIAFMNMEDSDVTDDIITSLMLSSDRLDLSLSQFDLINRNVQMFNFAPFNKTYDYSVGASNTNDAYVPAFPNTFVLLSREEIDQASLNVTFNPAAVNESKNYVAYRTFFLTREALGKSLKLSDKHKSENVDKLPIV